MRKYRNTFEFVDTEQEAVKRCAVINSRYTAYMRKNHPASFTPWSSSDGKEQKFIVWSKY